MREPTVPSTLQIREIEPEETITAYRTVRVGDVDDPDLPASFRSHYEEGLAPRYRQTQHAATHMAVSFWRNEETCRALAKRFPKHGAFIAQVALTHGSGFNVLDQGFEPYPEHLTVWGSKEALAAAVTDIVPV